MEKSFTLIVLAICMTFLVGTEALPRANRPYVVTRWYMMTGFTETPYSDCGSSSTIQKVEVIPCDNDDACILKTGSNTTFNIDFVPKAGAASLKAVVHGVVAGVPMPFHFPQEDACQKSNIECPIAIGQTYHYSVQLPIRKSYPKIKVTVKWELKDENGNDVVCIEIPARLQ